jgi:hypothetical protein
VIKPEAHVRIYWTNVLVDTLVCGRVIERNRGIGFAIDAAEQLLEPFRTTNGSAVGEDRASHSPIRSVRAPKPN